MSTPTAPTMAIRRSYAELLRQFASGRMTNDAYESRYFELTEKFRDPAVEAVFAAAWHLYCDLKTHRLRGDWRLDPISRRVIARSILFLRSESPYVSAEGESARCDRPARSIVIVPLAALLFAVCTGLAGWFSGFLGGIIALTAWLLWLIDHPDAAIDLDSVVTRAAWKSGPENIWPFSAREHLNTALGNAGYLGCCGASTHGD